MAASPAKADQARRSWDFRVGADSVAKVEKWRVTKIHMRGGVGKTLLEGVVTPLQKSLVV
jgi:hypothetical protein